MKLIFTKGEDNEITVLLGKGTVTDAFSYIEMIKQLLVSNKFEETEFNNISEDEQKRIETMLKKINEAIESEAQNPEEEN